jgi:hypothetical protein
MIFWSIRGGENGIILTGSFFAFASDAEQARIPLGNLSLPAASPTFAEPGD